MTRGAIPERQPLGDPIQGAVVAVGAGHVLAIPPPDDPAAVIASGALIARYAVPFLGKSHLSIVPGIVALDYGDMLTGEPAWDFLYKRSNLHPRADVVGYRNDGEDEMINVKYLDLALPPRVLIYPDEAATRPLAEALAVIAPPDAPLPPRLLAYLPRYDALADYLAEQEKDES